MDKTDPNINLEENFEYRIVPLNSGHYRAFILKDGKQFGAPSGELTYEGILAWIRIMIGDYPDSYKGEAA